jgi:hypothetical protein
MKVDVNDTLRQQGPDGVRQRHDNARRFHPDNAEHTQVNSYWPEPDLRLIDDDRVPAPRLEDDGLPAGWGDWISPEAEACGSPRDYVAAALIGAASGWIGNARRISANARWTEPGVLWPALIGPPVAARRSR